MENKMSINFEVNKKEAISLIKTLDTVYFFDKTNILEKIQKDLLNFVNADTILNGQIKLEDKIIVADPCFLNFDIYSNHIVSLDIVPGMYNCYINPYSLTRPKNVIVLLEAEDYTEDGFESIMKSIAVESGQGGIFNYSFYKQMYSLRFGEEVFREEYLKISDTTYIDNNYQKQIVDDKYFVTSTAYGDGAYQVFVKKNKDGKIIGIKIDYEKDMSDYELCQIMNKVGLK